MIVSILLLFILHITGSDDRKIKGFKAEPNTLDDQFRILADLQDGNLVPFLTKIHYDGNKELHGFYHDTHSVPQKPFENKDEIIYFLFEGSGDIQNRKKLIVAKIILIFEPDEVLNEKEQWKSFMHSHKVHIDGFYANTNDDTHGVLYELGDMKWVKIKKPDPKILDGHKITTDNEWKLNKKEWDELKAYLHKLRHILMRQKPDAVIPYTTHSATNDKKVYVFHPFSSRGEPRWKISTDDRTTTVSVVDMCPTAIFGEIKDTDHQYHFTHHAPYTLAMIYAANSIEINVNNVMLHTVDSTKIYWERQWGGECWRHAINSIYGMEKYTKCQALQMAQKADISAELQTGRGNDGLGIAKLIKNDFLLLWIPPLIRATKSYPDEKSQIEATKWIKGVVFDPSLPIKGVLKFDLTGHTFYYQKLTTKHKVKMFNYWLNLDSLLEYGPIGFRKQDAQHADRMVDVFKVQEMAFVIFEKNFDRKTKQKWFKDKPLLIKFWDEIIFTAHAERSNIYDDDGYFNDYMNERDREYLALLTIYALIFTCIAIMCCTIVFIGLLMVINQICK